MVEGTEWDGFWFEEIQDCREVDVATAMSRSRRGVCPTFHFFAGIGSGMADDENHWMYAFFDDAGIPLYDPPLKENMQNVPPVYIADLRRFYKGQDPERYIEGKRVALNKQEVIPNLRWHINVRNELSQRLSIYDPYRKFYIVFDFNVAPMCVVLAQVKEWTFETGRKPIICVVDEFEMWNATTAAMMDVILSAYGDHPGGVDILGDCTGNKWDTRSPGENDWKIIKRKAKRFQSYRVIEGLIQKRKKATAKVPRGERRVSLFNPPKRDSITLLNSLMIDGDGDPGVLFLPESKYQSGGAANAVASAKYNMESKIDSKNDKLDNTGSNAKLTPGRITSTTCCISRGTSMAAGNYLNQTKSKVA